MWTCYSVWRTVQAYLLRLIVAVEYDKYVFAGMTKIFIIAVGTMTL